jgi:GNAT superfamily N-acetyltransferase
MPRDPASFLDNSAQARADNPPAPEAPKVKAAPAAPASSAGTGALLPESKPAAGGDAPLSSNAAGSSFTVSAGHIFSFSDTDAQKVGEVTLAPEDAEKLLKGSGASFDKERNTYDNVPEATVKLLTKGPQSLAAEIKTRFNAGLADFHHSSLGMALAEGSMTAEDVRQRGQPDLVQLQLDHHPGAAWQGLGKSLNHFVEHPLDDSKDLLRQSIAKTAEALPSIADLVGKGTLGAAAGGTAAGLLLGPEAIPIGMKLGSAAGTFLSLYHQELGGRMAKLADSGLSDADIKKQAPAAAVKSAVGAGVFLYGVDAMAAPFKARFLQSLSAETAPIKSLTEKMASWAYNYGVNAGIKMPAIGVVHQMTSDLMDNMSALADKRPDLLKSPLEFSDNAIEAAAGMAQLGVVAGVPGAAFEAVGGAIDHAAETKAAAEMDAKLAGVERREPLASQGPSSPSASPSGGKMPGPSAGTASAEPLSGTPQAPLESSSPPSADSKSPLPDSIKEHPAYVKAVEGAKEFLPEGVSPDDRAGVADAYKKAADAAQEYRDIVIKTLTGEGAAEDADKPALPPLTLDEQNQVSANIDELATKMHALGELAVFAVDPEAAAAHADWEANGREGPEPPPVDPAKKPAAPEAAAPSLDETLANKDAKPGDIVKAAGRLGDKVQEATVGARATAVKADLDALQQRIGEIASTRDRMQKNGLSTRAIDRQLNTLLDKAVGSQKEGELLSARDPSELEVSPKAKPQMKPATLQNIMEAGFKEGGKQSQERARELLKIAEDNGLTANDVKKLIGNKAIGAMGDTAYKNFLNGFDRQIEDFDKKEPPRDLTDPVVFKNPSASKAFGEYTIKAEEDRIVALDKTGKEIGSLGVTGTRGDRPLGDVYVKEENRRQGIATAMYDFAESQLGKKFTPSNMATPDGEAFWKDRNSEHTPGFREGVEKLVERKKARAEVASVLQEKQLEKEQYIRQLNKLPAFSKMTTEQLKSYAEILRGYDKGDEALAPERIAALKGTVLEGVETTGEARAKAAQLTGQPVEDFQNVRVPLKARAIPDPQLREWFPALRPFVDLAGETSEKGERLAEIVRDRNETLAAEAIRERRALQGAGTRVADFFAPQQSEVMAYLEAKEPGDVTAAAERLTPAELKWAGFLKAWFGTAEGYLVKKEGMESRFSGAYAPHVNKGWPEILRDLKSQGIAASLKEFLPQAQGKNADFVDAQGDVLGSNKFFKQSIFRTGALDPSKNVVEAANHYISDFYRKAALDQIAPVLDTLARAMKAPPEETGLAPKENEAMTSSLQDFVKAYANNKKGINNSAGAVGEMLAPALRMSQTLAAVHYIAANYALQIIKGSVAIPVTEYMALGTDLFKAKGLKFTDQGKAILSKYESFTGKSPWQEVGRPGADAQDFARALAYGGFGMAHKAAMGDLLLGSMTKEEFAAGTISDARLNQIRQEAGRWMDLSRSASIMGSSTVGKTFTQYKGWAIPPTLTLAEDARALARAVAGKGKMSDVQVRETLRLVSLAAMAGTVGTIATKDMEDDSFRGQAIHYLRRAVGSVWRGLDPPFFFSAAGPGYVAKLANDLHLLGTLERDKNDELKGVKALKKDLTPRLVKDVQKATEEE